jgi:hypothetical protein
VDVSVGDLYAAGRDPALGGLDPLMVAAELGEREKPWEVRSVRDSRAFGAALGRWGLDGAMSDAALSPSPTVYQLRVVLAGAL